MFKMKAQNREILQMVLSGVATPKEIAATYGVDVNKVYKLTHAHRAKAKLAEEKAKRLYDMDKRKKEEAKADAKSVVRRRGWWGKLQIEREKEQKASKPVQRYLKHHNADELQKIAITARKLHAISVAQGVTPTQPEDYFERLKGAQAEIDRLNKESIDQKREIKELLAQNGMLMRIISKRA